MVFRLDDFTASSPKNIEKRIIDHFRSQGVPLTIAVTPRVAAYDIRSPEPQPLLLLSKDDGRLLRDAVRDGTVEVALHGYSHQSTSADDLAEFDGMRREEQARRIRVGKADLEQLLGVKIDVFAPPWNRYDRTTLRVLNGLGFKTITADRSGTNDESVSLRYLPASCDAWELPEAIAQARASDDRQPLIVVLAHLYDFKEIDPVRGQITIEEFLEIISRCRAEPNLRFLTASQASAEISDLGALRLQAVSARRDAFKLLPGFLNRHDETLYYEEHATVFGPIAQVATLVILAGLAGFGLSVPILSRLLPRSSVAGALAQIGLAGLAAVPAYSLYDGRVGAFGCLAMAAAIGAFLGGLMALRNRGQSPALVQIEPAQ